MKKQGTAAHQEEKKSRPRHAVTAVLVVMVGVFIGLTIRSACVDDSDQHVRTLRITPTMSSRTPSALSEQRDPFPPTRPRWLNAPTAIEGEDSFEDFTTWLKGFMAVAVTKSLDRIPFNDVATIGKFSEAMDIAISCPEPSRMWHWDQVVETIEAIGTDSPFLDAKASHYTLPEGALSYVSYPEATVFYTTAEAIVSDTPERLAALIVHEATHAVFDREMRRLSGLSIQELALIANQCPDFLSMFLFATESVAFHNQASFMECMGSTDRDRFTGKMGEILSGMIDGFRGDMDVHRHVGTLVQDYISFEIWQQHHERPVPRVTCGPPYIMHDPHRGMRFYPSDVAPDIVVPLMEGYTDD